MSLKDTLSPFRYPGGKTWLIPHVRRWLNSFAKRPTELLEPFAGGGSIGLAAANEGLVDHVTLVEIDEAVASVWRVIINGDDDVQLLLKRIRDFEMTEYRVEMVLSQQPESLNDLAFRTILRNRISRGGILAPGAGRLKRGEDDKGLKSRWYPETLIHRISQIVRLRSRITFIQGDGFQVMRRFAGLIDTVFFIDPPYTAGHNGAGKRLYSYPIVDHDALFRLVSQVEGDFLMTYDSDAKVQRLTALHNFDTEQIRMTTTHNSPKTEILIGKDLTWVRQ
jgi:DNA adenine methylase